MVKKKEPKTNNGPESSHKKDNLIKALRPLCNDFPWMTDLITSIKAAPLLETNFEISGLARSITYELLKENPMLLKDKNNIKTLPLKNLILQLNNQVDVLKNRKESIAKATEEAYNSLVRKKAIKKQSKL